MESWGKQHNKHIKLNCINTERYKNNNGKSPTLTEILMCVSGSASTQSAVKPEKSTF